MKTYKTTDYIYIYNLLDRNDASTEEILKYGVRMFDSWVISPSDCSREKWRHWVKTSFILISSSLRNNEATLIDQTVIFIPRRWYGSSETLELHLCLYDMLPKKCGTFWFLLIAAAHWFQLRVCIYPILDLVLKPHVRFLEANSALHVWWRRYRTVFIR